MPAWPVTWADRPLGRTPESARWALTAFIAALVRGRNDGVLMSTRASSTTPSVLRNIDASDGVFSAVT